MGAVLSPFVGVRTSVANVFTAAPQSVGTAFSTGQAEIFAGQITLAANGAAPPTLGPPILTFVAYCGGAAGNNGWQIGVDSSNHGGGQDLAFSMLINSVATDFFYANYDHTNSAVCVGVGTVIPPTGTYQLEVKGPGTNSVGGLRVIQNASSTASLFALAASSAVDQIWVDENFRFRAVNGGNGFGFVAESTFNQAFGIWNAAQTQLWQYVTNPTNNSLQLVYITGGSTVVWETYTNGGIEFYNTVRFDGQLSFFHGTYVSQQSTTGTTTGFTAGAGTAMNSASTSTGGTGTAAYTFGDIVLALKNYNLIAN